MGRKKADKVFGHMVRVSDELYSHLVSLQKTERFPDKPAPKYAEFLDRIWAASGGKPLKAPSPYESLPSAERVLVDNLIHLLNSGSEMRSIIEPALAMYGQGKVPEPEAKMPTKKKVRTKSVYETRGILAV